MAITDYKITQGEVDDNKVESAPDVLSDTPSENKKVFDQLVKVFIAKYNDLIDNIDTDFVDSSEFAEGLTVTDKVRWRYALTKGTSIGLNFSGTITQITTGYRTIVGDIDGLTETDFMDCYLSINGTDYECGDSYASGNSILTSAVINGVTVGIIYDTTNGNITLEHATNPLDTLYWNVSIYRSVAEKVPRKALPADISNDGYTELKSEGTKWNGVSLDKTTVDDCAGYFIPVTETSSSNTANLASAEEVIGDNIIAPLNRGLYFRSVKVAQRTLPSSNYASGSFDLGSDYGTPVGVIGVKILRSDGETSHGVTVSSAYIDNGFAYYQIFNGGANERTVDVFLSVLYIRNEPASY